MTDRPARVPAIVRHYAAYLHARAYITPRISIDANRAELSLDISDKVLVAVFGCRKRTGRYAASKSATVNRPPRSPAASWRRRWPRSSPTSRERPRHWRSAVPRSREPTPRSASGVPRSSGYERHKDATPGL